MASNTLSLNFIDFAYPLNPSLSSYSWLDDILFTMFFRPRLVSNFGLSTTSEDSDSWLFRRSNFLASLISLASLKPSSPKVSFLLGY